MMYLVGEGYTWISTCCISLGMETHGVVHDVSRWVVTNGVVHVVSRLRGLHME